MKKAPTLLVRKVGHVLHAADVVTDDYLAEIPQGREIAMKPWLPRNPRFHRTAMGYLNMVANNNDIFTDIDAIKKHVMLELGMFEVFIGHDGQTVYRMLESIDFDSMDEVHFRRFMRRAEFIITRDIMPLGVEDYVQFKRELGKQVAQYEGGADAGASPAPTEDQG